MPHTNILIITTFAPSWVSLYLCESLAFLKYIGMFNMAITLTACTES